MPASPLAGKHAMPSNPPSTGLTHLAVPKGRIEPGVTALLAAEWIARKRYRLP